MLTLPLAVKEVAEPKPLHITLGDMRPGHWRALTDTELRALLDTLGQGGDTAGGAQEDLEQ